MRQKLSGQPVCSGVDWITVTQRPGAEMEILRQQAYALAAVELSRGEFGRPWFASGYEGFSVGGVFYGERYDGCIFQLSGVVSAAHWQRAYEHCASVTRIDLQVTVCTREDPYVVLQRHWKELKRHAAKMQKPPKHRIIVDGSKAVTLYSGAPASARYGRIYDKGRESKQKAFQSCVRYELVLRGRKAKAVTCLLSRSRDSKLQIALRSLVFFQERGCSLRSIINLFGESTFLNVLKSPIVPSTLERKSEWIAKAVRPTVLQIEARIGRQKTLELVGLC